MRSTVLTLLALALFAFPVLAVDPPEDNGLAVLGIYTMPEAGPDAQTHLSDVVAGVPYDLYFVLYHANLTSHNLGGFEFNWSVEPAAATPLVTGIEWMLDNEYAYNFGDNFNLLVGFARMAPHLPEEPFMLFKATVLWTEVPTNAAVYLGPSTPDSIDGEMAYADLVYPDELHVMVPNNASQTFDEPVFRFIPTVATEAHSLSSVKALFD